MPLQIKLFLFHLFAGGGIALTILSVIVLVVFRSHSYAIFLASGWFSLMLMWLFLPDADDFLRDIRKRKQQEVR